MASPVAPPPLLAPAMVPRGAPASEKRHRGGDDAGRPRRASRRQTARRRDARGRGRRAATKRSSTSGVPEGAERRRAWRAAGGRRARAAATAAAAARAQVRRERLGCRREIRRRAGRGRGGPAPHATRLRWLARRGGVGDGAASWTARWKSSLHRRGAWGGRQAQAGAARRPAWRERPVGRAARPRRWGRLKGAPPRHLRAEAARWAAGGTRPAPGEAPAAPRPPPPPPRPSASRRARPPLTAGYTWSATEPPPVEPSAVPTGWCPQHRPPPAQRRRRLLRPPAWHHSRPRSGEPQGCRTPPPPALRPARRSTARSPDCRSGRQLGPADGSVRRRSPPASHPAPGPPGCSPWRKWSAGRAAVGQRAAKQGESAGRRSGRTRRLLRANGVLGRTGWRGLHRGDPRLEVAHREQAHLGRGTCGGRSPRDELGDLRREVAAVKDRQAAHRRRGGRRGGGRCGGGAVARPVGLGTRGRERAERRPQLPTPRAHVSLDAVHLVHVAPLQRAHAAEPLQALVKLPADLAELVVVGVTQRAHGKRHAREDGRRRPALHQPEKFVGVVGRVAVACR
eukprot:scaffold15539_cov110-Isochrysis_galbana.AAC.2